MHLIDVEQRTLADANIEPLRHDVFVSDQVDHFTAIQPAKSGLVFDIGGGCGYFARALRQRFPDIDPTVIDYDRPSIDACRAAGIAALHGDAVAYRPSVAGGSACFNLVLHHLVGDSERATRKLQLAALGNWRDRPVFVNEYIYDSWLGDAAGRVIYALTASRHLVPALRLIGRIVPALRANTSGVGVRFRSRGAWEKLFREAGFTVAAHSRGREEQVQWLLRPLIRSIRRDSFLLQPS